jgi:hypothetical protein
LNPAFPHIETELWIPHGHYAASGMMTE